MICEIYVKKHYKVELQYQMCTYPVYEFILNADITNTDFHGHYFHKIYTYDFIHYDFYEDRCYYHKYFPILSSALSRKKFQTLKKNIQKKALQNMTFSYGV